MGLKNIIKVKVWLIWVLGIVLLICSVLTLNEFYFISNVAQNIYYGIYAVLFFIIIFVICRQYDLSIHHGFLMLINLFLVYIIYLNPFIAIPLCFIFPLLFHSKSDWIFKIFSTISYILLLLALCFILFVRIIFTSTTLVQSVDSPNNKQMIQVYSINEGALGGATDVKLVKKYLYVFKKSRTIYYGHYGEDKDVKWIDMNHVQIDGKTIDTSQ